MGSVGKVLRLFPGPAEELAAEEAYADLRLPGSEIPREDPCVAINMVSTLNGKVSVGGKASPIGSDVDRLMMRNIRSAFDAILVGAGTVRAEEMNLSIPPALSERRKARGLNEQPLGVVLAGAGDLLLGRKVFRSQGEGRTVVIAGEATPESTLERASAIGVRVLRTDGPGLPTPEEILRLLREHLDVRAVLLEGGPTINGAFLSAGCIDQLFLTLSPKISLCCEKEPTIAANIEPRSSTTHLELASVYASVPQSELYLRYLRNTR